VLLGFCVTVLAMADSATSIACFTLGTVLLLATYLPFISRRPGRIHVLVVMILFVGGLTMLLGGQSGVVHALGRQTNLTGRTDIWAAVLPVVPNPVVGAGFESFWMGPRLQKVYNNLSGYMHVNEAHNGYIEVYLNLGWVGVGLIAINLISGYRGSVAAFRRNPTFGGLMLAYVAAAAIYSVTEAGFRMLDPIWMFLLLAIVGSHSVASGRGGATGKRLGARARPVTSLSDDYELASAR
jgi:O-antigen ligase